MNIGEIIACMSRNQFKLEKDKGAFENQFTLFEADIEKEDECHQTQRIESTS